MSTKAGNSCASSTWSKLNGLHKICVLFILYVLFSGAVDLCGAAPQGEDQNDKGCQTICDKYSIIYNGYDASQADNIEVRYLVSVENGACGLSNWILELPGCMDEDAILSAGPGEWEFVETADIRGIKFDSGVEQPEAGEPANSMVYFLRLRGPYWTLEDMPEMKAIIKAGTGTCHKAVQVPGCPIPS